MSLTATLVDLDANNAKRAFGHGILPVQDTSLLTDEINAATRSIHNELHQVSNLKLVMAMRDHTLYREYIRSFYWVYRTLEEEIATSELPSLAKIGAMDILRTQAIDRDLKFWYGPAFPEVIAYPKSKLERQVIEHIRSLGRRSPESLLAWSHVMFLALFAGGKVIRSKVLRSLGFMRNSKDGAGADMYAFPDPEQLRVDVKKIINEAGAIMSLEERARVVDESVEVFAWNTRLISGLRMQQKVYPGLILLAGIVLLVVYLIWRLVL